MTHFCNAFMISGDVGADYWEEELFFISNTVFSKDLKCLLY